MKMTKRIIAVLFAVFMAVSALSITMTASAATKVTKVTLNKTSATMYTTKTLTLKATVKPSKASNKKVKWTTSDKKIATVDKNGKVKAVKAGKVTITATAADGSGKKATCKITVKKLVKIKSMKLSDKTVNVGKSSTLKVTVSPSNASIQKYTWKSSNTKVATVDSNGKVKGIKEGTATITATATDGSGKKATCKVTVKKVSVTSVKLNKTSATIYPSKSITLTATVSPSNATVSTVKWTSSNTSVATVTSAGVVKGIKAGTATITCAATDGSGKKATCKITVGTYVKSVSITSDPTSSWYVGKTGKLTAEFTPSNATNKKLTWTSSDDKYATVDANGNVKILKIKTNILGKPVNTAVTITATTADGSGVKATYTVNITAYKAVESVAFASTDSTTVYVNETKSFAANVTPTDASERKITYKSSNTAVATVDANGNVKGIKAGTAKITATSIEGKSASIDITVKPVSFSSAEIRTPKDYYIVGDEATFFCLTDPVDAMKNLGIVLESENENVAVFEPATSPDAVFFKLKFVGVGKTRVRALTKGAEAKSDWVTVEVRDLRSDKEYFQNATVGTTYSTSVYMYNGEALLSQTDKVYFSLDDENDRYFDVAFNSATNKFDITVIDNIPAQGAYVLFKDETTRLSHKVWFVSGSYTIPSANLDTMKKYSNKAVNVVTADAKKTISYTDIVVDNNKSSSELKFNNMDLGGFLKWAEKIFGSSDSGDVSEDEIANLVSAETFIKEFFNGTEEESGKFDRTVQDYPEAIKVDAADVKEVKITNDNNKATYQIKLTLKDQSSYIALDAVASSAYGKTMKVVDRAYMNSYKSQLSQTVSDSDGDVTTSLDYGTVSQKYSGGYVVYTIDKVTDNVVESEYHFKSAMKIDKAILDMTANMKLEGFNIKMVTKIIGYFTMNVESTTKYTAMKY